MSKLTIIWLAISAAVLVALGSCTASYITTRQGYVSLEVAISAQDREMQNVDTELTNNLHTQGLASQMYKQTVIDAFHAANSGRYGADGSKAMFQFIKEQNPNIDAGIYRKLMICAEAGYAKFTAAQRKKIDLCRVYRSKVERAQVIPIWGGMVTAGFPRKSWDEMERTIVSQETQDTWKTGVQKAKTF